MWQATASTTWSTGLAGGRDWEGMHPAREQGDLIGMLLDLDQKSMTVWKNDEKAGVMQAERLTGPLCWPVSLFRQDSSARIELRHCRPSDLPMCKHVYPSKAASCVHVNVL